MRLLPIVVLWAACAGAWAQVWPAKPVRFIIPQTPGGTVDAVGRTVAQHLSERLGQPWVAENRAGAGGAIGFESVAKAAPDGYTFLMSNQSGMVFGPVLKKTLPYDPIRDFTSIGMLFETPYYLVAHPSVPARTLQELLALARSQPGKLNYATVGVGSGQHLFMEIFRSVTGVNMVHVPYKGSSQAIADILAGNVQVMLQFSGFTVPNAKSGKTRVIATTGSQRTLALPDVPTVIEAGLPGYTAATWYSVSVPARLPAAIVERLNREINQILRLPSVVERFAPADNVLLPGRPEVVTERIHTDLPLFMKAAREAGIEQE